MKFDTMVRLEAALKATEPPVAVDWDEDDRVYRLRRKNKTKTSEGEWLHEELGVYRSMAALAAEFGIHER